MKTCIKSSEPELLGNYRQENPDASWETFKADCRDGYQSVTTQIRRDQGNLCCYCEIDTKTASGNALDDFRVEHFHPKSDQTTAQNWGLDWNNLLGCCHGGSQQYIFDEENRYIDEHSKRHSDVLKDNFNWDDEILNPLSIPNFPVLFKVNRLDGSLEVIEQHCHQAGIDLHKARNCLAPDKLNLNSDKLKILRKKMLDSLNESQRQLLISGLSPQQVYQYLVGIFLTKNEQDEWPAFFTSVRSYLGKPAEQHLRNIGYQG